MFVQPYGYDTPRWRAAVLAALLTFTPLLGLYLAKKVAKPVAPSTHDIVLTLIQPKPRPAVAPPRDMLVSRHEPRPARPMASKPRVVDEAMPSPASVSSVAIAVPPSLASSAPAPLDLRIRPGTLAATRSEVMKMADISGTYTGDAPVGQAARLANEMSKEHKPDCLGPNAGGSLLSVLVIAYMAAKDKCN
ncbi:MAG TPA: hypothetical protein VGM81_04475 [Burkholderiaceae bacterium]|jgi:hypothetical protein